MSDPNPFGLMYSTRAVHDWFVKYGATLDDRHSFEIQARNVEREIEAMGKVIDDLKANPDQNAIIVEATGDFEAELPAAHALLVLLKQKAGIES